MAHGYHIWHSLIISGRFVRASKYRHVYGQPAKKELQYENLRITSNAWDSNLIKCNGKYISVNWNSSGGGAFAVIPVKEVGKIPDQVPLFRGHTAQVLDTDFSPFNDHIVASGSDDGKIGIWEIPEDYGLHEYVDEEGNPKDLKPVRMLSGHSRKVGHLLFHPLAENILASSSLDYTVKIWDISQEEVKFTLKHPDMVTSMSFSYDGKHLVTVSRDKKLRVWDVRAEKIVSEGPAHSGAKNQRVVWLGDTDKVATTGFSRLSDRQIGVWDAFNLEKGNLGGFYNVDQSSGILMPFYDDSNRILYVAGKGDGNIRYFEFQNDELYELSEYQSTEPQRGFAVAPKRSVNVKENEVLKAYKAVGEHAVEPISFYVPRKSEVFQDDIYPDAPSSKPALSAAEWVEGKSVDGPILFKLQTLYDGSEPEFTDSKKPVKELTSESKEQPKSPSQSPSQYPSTEVKHEVIIQLTPSNKSKKTSPSPASSSSSGSPARKEMPPAKDTGKNQVDELLSKDASVNKLLQKASDLDADNEAENPSEESSVWDSEDEKIVKASQQPEVVVKVEANTDSEPDKAAEEVPQQKEENSSTEITSKASASSKVESTPEAKVEASSQAIVETNIRVNPSQEDSEEKPSSNPNTGGAAGAAAAAGASTNKSLNLRQSVETLSGLVLKLESYIDKLTEENTRKDEILATLEAKVDRLLEQGK